MNAGFHEGAAVAVPFPRTALERDKIAWSMLSLSTLFYEKEYMKRRINLIIVSLAFAIIFFAGSARSEEYICRVSVGAITLDNVLVPQDATCTLHGTYVEGTIYVEANATLRAYQVDVIGNVQADNAALVEVLSGSTVGGSIQIKQGGGAQIDNVRIDSDLQFEDNDRNLIANRNIIGGNLQAFQNTGGISITANTIDGNLQCKENVPFPTGGDNIVMGSTEDQCASMASPDTSRVTLTIERSGTGFGTVSSNPPGISCGTDCSESYAQGTVVTLTATPDTGSAFTSWTGYDAVSGNVCSLTMNATRSVTALFAGDGFFDMYFDTVQEVYIGYYQRPADPGGLLYWAQRLYGTNGNLNEIIEAFANSSESLSLYGTITSSNISTLVDRIYMALFNRPAEAEGKAYYVEGFNAGRFTAAKIMLNVLYGAQNQDLLSINNKVSASNVFTRTIDPELVGYNLQATYAGNSDAIAGRDFLTFVTWNSSTVPTQEETRLFVQTYIADPGDPILIP
jgi:hypothetical protein